MPGFKRGSEAHIKYLEEQNKKLRKENKELKLFQPKDQEQLLKDIHKDLTESMSLIYSKINNIQKGISLLTECKHKEYNHQIDLWDKVMKNIKELDKLGNGS